MNDDNDKKNALLKNIDLANFKKVNLILLILVKKLIKTFILCKHEIPVDTLCLRFTMRKPITNVQVMNMTYHL